MAPYTHEYYKQRKGTYTYISTDRTLRRYQSMGFSPEIFCRPEQKRPGGSHSTYIESPRERGRTPVNTLNVYPASKQVIHQVTAAKSS